MSEEKALISGLTAWDGHDFVNVPAALLRVVESIDRLTVAVEHAEATVKDGHAALHQALVELIQEET